MDLLTNQVNSQSFSVKAARWYASIDKVKHAYAVAFMWWAGAGLAVASFNLLMDVTIGRFAMEGVIERFWVMISIALIILLGFCMLYARLFRDYMRRSAQRSEEVKAVDVNDLDALDKMILKLDDHLLVIRIGIISFGVLGLGLIATIFILGRNTAHIPYLGYLWGSMYATGVLALLFSIGSPLTLEAGEVAKCKRSLRKRAYQIREGR